METLTKIAAQNSGRLSFYCVPAIADGCTHNVAIEDEQWEQLDLIVRRVGDRKSNATSYLNSIIAAHLRKVLPKVKEWMKL